MMDGRLLVLLLVLWELGISPDIRSIANRRKIQHAIYLMQRAGVDLGYQFGWYRLGPWSNHLTSDYYALFNVIDCWPREGE